MKIEIKLEEKTNTMRKYRMKYRKDGRFTYINSKVTLTRCDVYGWCLNSYEANCFILPREAILKIESIMRGLNSNG